MHAGRPKQFEGNKLFSIYLDIQMKKSALSLAQKRGENLSSYIRRLISEDLLRYFDPDANTPSPQANLMPKEVETPQNLTDDEIKAYKYYSGIEVAKRNGQNPPIRDMVLFALGARINKKIRQSQI